MLYNNTETYTEDITAVYSAVFIEYTPPLFFTEDLKAVSCIDFCKRMSIESHYLVLCSFNTQYKLKMDLDATNKLSVNSYIT